MSKIGWTDTTDNLIVVKGSDGKFNGWYCEKVSAGCANCYAEETNQNTFFKGNKLPYHKPKNGQRPPLMLRHEIMAKWPRMRKSKRHFINSMTDTFGEFVPEEFIYQIFDAMAAAPKQEFQILTKRAKRMQDIVTQWLEMRGIYFVPKNIILMVSVENQHQANMRIPLLLDIPARRGLSIEPMLEHINLHYLSGIDWIIVGGESGKKARPFDLSWAYSIVKQSKETNIPIFVKQFGENPTSIQWGYTITGKGDNWDEWPVDLQIREFPDEQQ